MDVSLQGTEGELVLASSDRVSNDPKVFILVHFYLPREGVLSSLRTWEP